jgi:hypothetical protein
MKETKYNFCSNKDSESQIAPINNFPNFIAN